MAADPKWRYRRSVKTRCLDRDLLLSHLKHLVVSVLRFDQSDPDTMANNTPLSGGCLGLDSLDSLELAICVEEEFGVAVCGGQASPRIFASFASLADFIQAGARTSPTGLLGAAKIGAWSGVRSAAAAPSPAWQPVFASGAMLTF